MRETASALMVGKGLGVQRQVGGWQAGMELITIRTTSTQHERVLVVRWTTGLPVPSRFVLADSLRSLNFTVAVRSWVSLVMPVVTAPGLRLVASSPVRPGEDEAGRLR